MGDTRCTRRGYATEIPPVPLTVRSHLNDSRVALYKENLVVQCTILLRLITSFYHFLKERDTPTITSYREGRSPKVKVQPRGAALARQLQQQEADV